MTVYTWAILRDLFKFPDDYQLEIHRQAQAAEDARENMFHCLPAFFSGYKLTDRSFTLW